MTRRLPVEGARPAALLTRSPRLARLEGDARRLLERGPRRRKNAPDRHVGKEAEHDEGEQRAQVAAAGAGEVAAGAAAGEHHAEAEHQAAQDMPRPVEAGAGEVHGLVERDHAARLQQLGADERRGAGQDPGAEAAPVAEVVDVARASPWRRSWWQTPRRRTGSRSPGRRAPGRRPRAVQCVSRSASIIAGLSPQLSSCTDPPGNM